MASCSARRPLAAIAALLIILIPSRSAGAPDPSGVQWAWSGGVTARGAVVKARIAPAGASAELTLVRVDGGEVVATRTVVTDAEGIATFVLDGLSPAARHEYRITAAGRAPLAGTFRTFGDGPIDFTVAFASCAKTGSTSPVFDAIRAAQPDLFVHMGDLHYENISSNDPAAFGRAYDRVLRSRTQALLYRAVPIAYTWDDHDFGGNNADSTAASRPAALRAYRSRVPHYPVADDGRDGIHQAFDIGRVRFIVTDARSQRTSNRGMPAEARTILGAAQRQWLLDQFTAASERPLVVWVNTVPWIARPRSGSDDWGSYDAERAVIAGHIASLGLTRRLVMLSGDAHMVALDDGTHSQFAPGVAGPGFVVAHAAPLDQITSRKGGPYSHGLTRERGQFGLLSVRDDGTTLRLDVSGRDRRGAPIPGKRLALVCGGGTGCASAPPALTQ